MKSGADDGTRTRDLRLDENCQFKINFLPEDGMDSINIYGYFTEAQTQQIIYDNINIDNTMTVRYRGYYANDDETDYVVTLEKNLLMNGRKEE